MSGRYCSIHSLSSTSPKYRSPPQLVGDLAGGAWWSQIHRSGRLVEASASCAPIPALTIGPSHQGQAVKSVLSMTMDSPSEGLPRAGSLTAISQTSHRPRSWRRDRDCRNRSEPGSSSAADRNICAPPRSGHGRRPVRRGRDGHRPSPPRRSRPHSRGPNRTAAANNGDRLPGEVAWQGLVRLTTTPYT